MQNRDGMARTGVTSIWDEKKPLFFRWMRMSQIDHSRAIPEPFPWLVRHSLAGPGHSADATRHDVSGAWASSGWTSQTLRLRTTMFSDNSGGRDRLRKGTAAACCRNALWGLQFAHFVGESAENSKTRSPQRGIMTAG